MSASGGPGWRLTMAVPVLALAGWALGADGLPPLLPASPSAGAFLAALVVALGIGLAALRTPYQASAAWLALALAGQAAVQQAVAAGTAVGYPHLHAPGWVLASAPGLVRGILGLQLAAVGLGLVPRLAALWRGSGAVLPGWRLALVLLAMIVTSAALSRDPAALGTELVFATALQGLALATLVLAAWALPSGTLTGRAGAWLTRAEPATRPPYLLAGTATLVALALAILAYGRSPHIPDEVAYLIQARQFAAGQLVLPLPPVAPAFDVDLLYFATDRVYSCFPPGWPLALALGVLLGVPWLLNPLLTGLNVLLAERWLRRLLPPNQVRLVLVLMATSPWQLFLGMSYMGHAFTLTCALLAALALERASETRAPGFALLSGLAVAMLSLIRPLDALAVAGLLGLRSLGLAGAALPFRGLVTFGLGTAVGGALNLAYNAAVTGSARTFPVMAYFDHYYWRNSNAMGFGPERGVGWGGLDPLPGHGAPDVLINAQLNLFMVNMDLFGWATGSLLLVFVALVLARWDRPVRVAVLAIATVAGLHSLYWFSGGPDFGARYWWLTFLPALILAARGALAVAQRLESHGVPDAAGRVAAFVGGSVLVALVAFVPWRAQDKYTNYRRMPSGSAAVAHDATLGRSVVLVAGKRFPDYMALAAWNPVPLDGSGPVFVWERDSTVRAAVEAAFPGRPVVRLAGPSLSGGGYHRLPPDGQPDSRSR